MRLLPLALCGCDLLVGTGFRGARVPKAPRTTFEAQVEAGGGKDFDVGPDRVIAYDMVAEATVGVEANRGAITSSQLAGAIGTFVQGPVGLRGRFAFGLREGDGVRTEVQAELGVVTLTERIPWWHIFWEHGTVIGLSAFVGSSDGFEAGLSLTLEYHQADRSGEPE